MGAKNTARTDHPRTFGSDNRTYSSMSSRSASVSTRFTDSAIINTIFDADAEIGWLWSFQTKPQRDQVGKS